MKKFSRFLASMKFAVLLLVILAAACTAGSFITQGQTYEWYAQTYNDRIAALIIALSLDDAFHSWWFAAITAFLCLNLLMCSVLRFPQIRRRFRSQSHPEEMVARVQKYAVCLREREEEAWAQQQNDAATDASKELSSAQPSPEAGILPDPLPLFDKMHMPKPKEGRTLPEEAGIEESASGKRWYYSAKNTAGLWGAWICHLGILMLIAGFGLGQMRKAEYMVYGVPGQKKEIGDTGLSLQIDDFHVLLRDDDTVEQYTADITVFSDDDPDRSGQAQISVNEPASMFGMKFYQNSTGWAETVTVTKDGQPLQEKVLCAGEYLPVKDKPELVIYLNAFYPDYVRGDDGMPMTASGKLNNPASLYTVYYQGSVLGMNVLLPEEVVTIDEYVVRFSNPQTYTLIQVKKDVFTPLALLGGLVTLTGLIFALYLLPERMAALQLEDGRWIVAGESRKGGLIYRKRFEKMILESGGKVVVI